MDPNGGSRGEPTDGGKDTSQRGSIVDTSELARRIPKASRFEIDLSDVEDPDESPRKDSDSSDDGSGNSEPAPEEAESRDRSRHDDESAERNTSSAVIDLEDDGTSARPGEHEPDSQEQESAESENENRESESPILHPVTKQPLTRAEVEKIVSDSVNSRRYRDEATRKNTETKTDISARETELTEREKQLNQREKAIAAQEHAIRTQIDDFKKRANEQSEAAAKAEKDRIEREYAAHLDAEPDRDEFANAEKYRQARIEWQQRRDELFTEKLRADQSNGDGPDFDLSAVDQGLFDTMIGAFADWINDTADEWEPLGGVDAATEAITEYVNGVLGHAVYPAQVPHVGRNALNAAKRKQADSERQESLSDAASRGEQTAREEARRRTDNAAVKIGDGAATTTANRPPKTQREWLEAVVRGERSQREYEDALAEAKADAEKERVFLEKG